MVDGRLYAPATLRNREPILQVLKNRIKSQSSVLEIASGSGEHGLYFTQQLPDILWQPSDSNLEAFNSINAWQQSSPQSNYLAPLNLDVQNPGWWKSLAESMSKSLPLSTIVNINMIHISPWTATEGLFAGVSELLPPHGLLYLYGPFKRDGRHTAESNAQFDVSLRTRNPLWGVRDLETVTELGQQFGLELQDIIEMPANNLSLFFSRVAH